MSAKPNKFIGIGNLTGDPVMGSLQNGDIMCRFSMACNDHHVNIVMWREMAEIAEKYLKKGSRVYISGMITTSTWDESGITEIIAESMQKLDNEF